MNTSVIDRPTHLLNSL